jgi:KUP system potassium uptake protein
VSSSKSSLAALTLGAIGVVYGDIGTSVLYAMKEVFGSGHVPFTPDNVYGILSIFFWTLTTIVSVKYVVLVLKADNHGEGGLVAMLALASQSVKDRPELRKILLVVGIFGTCLFYGDGVITPAISVLSAVEGLEVVSPAFKKAVIPLTLVILLALFWVQKRGTAGIGKFFGPITLVWFGVIALLGGAHIASHPEILWAISPHYALGFIWNHTGTTFIILGAVVLCVTGGEALYADMGHFGKKPIRLAWFSIVMPALTLNYFGQGALLLSEPEAVKNPFFMMAPDWALLPLVGLATMATVIASQALISGAFSVTKQVIQLGFLPRLQVLHTSETDTGQIYMPFVNWGLFVAIVLAVVPLVQQSCGGLRHCSVHRHADHHCADLLRDPFRLEATPCTVHRRHRVLFCGGPGLLGLQPAQAARRWLVPAGDRCGHLHADAYLVRRAPPAQRVAALRCAAAGRFSGGCLHRAAHPGGRHGRVHDS